MKQKQRQLSLKHLVQGFILSKCELGQEYEIEQPILYQAFQEWCVACETRMYNKKDLTNAMFWCCATPINSTILPYTVPRYKKEWHKTIRVYKGIRLKQSA